MAQTTNRKTRIVFIEKDEKLKIQERINEQKKLLTLLAVFPSVNDRGNSLKVKDDGFLYLADQRIMDKNILNQTTLLIEKGYLQADIKGVLYLCPHCLNSKIKIELKCSVCNSFKIKKYTVSRHSLCGSYIFYSKDVYGQCHFCGKPLVSAIEDKGSIFQCMECDSYITEPEEIFYCQGCGKELGALREEKRQLKIVEAMDIKRTESGEKILINGNFEEVLSKNNNGLIPRGIQSLRLFRDRLKTESVRVDTDGGSFSIIAISIKNGEALSRPSRSGFSILAHVTGFYRKEDQIAFFNENTLLLLFPDMNFDKVKHMSRRIINRIQSKKNIDRRLVHAVIATYPDSTSDYSQLIPLLMKGLKEISSKKNNSILTVSIKSAR